MSIAGIFTLSTLNSRWQLDALGCVTAVLDTPGKGGRISVAFPDGTTSQPDGDLVDVITMPHGAVLRAVRWERDPDGIARLHITKWIGGAVPHPAGQ